MLIFVAWSRSIRVTKEDGQQMSGPATFFAARQVALHPPHHPYDGLPPPQLFPPLLASSEPGLDRWSDDPGIPRNAPGLGVLRNGSPADAPTRWLRYGFSCAARKQAKRRQKLVRTISQTSDAGACQLRTRQS